MATAPEDDAPFCPPAAAASPPAAAAEAEERAATPLPLLFLHIPKTAGTSFIATLRNAFGHDRLLRLATVDSTTPAEIGRLLGGDETTPACLVGHIPYHMIAPWRDRCAVFTILRHPIPRVLSLFRFLRQQPEEEQRRLGLAPGFSFDAFLRSRHPELFGQIHDGMTRMLSGDPDLYNPDSSRFWDDTPSPAVLDAALATLRSVDFGLAEDMAGTLALVRRLWNIPYPLSIGHENVTNATAAAPASDDSLRVGACNAMDLVLYQQAEALFAARCAAAARGQFAAAAPARFSPTLGEETRLDCIPGLQGFHEFEADGFAWLDSEQTARLRFSLAPQTVRIRLRGYALTADYPVAETRLELNGKHLPAEVRQDEGHWFTLTTAPVALAREEHELVIRPPYFLPVRYVDPSSADERTLALAFATITVQA